MKVLSLFSGIGGFDLAFHEIFGEDHIVYYSEIDPYATKIYQNHFPNSIELGDIEKIDFNSLSDIDMVFGGSPCQDLSSLNFRREGLSGNRSRLFYKYVEAINILKPKYFILENVNSMKPEDKAVMTKEIGVNPIMIDASLVSAQKRKRLFWIGKRNKENNYDTYTISLPEDSNILLKDIIENGEVDVDKSYCIDSCYYKGGSYSNYLKKRRRQVVILDSEKDLVRLLTPNECEKLQCFPVGWCDGFSNTRKYKALGNAVNVLVAKHIFEEIRKDIK